MEKSDASEPSEINDACPDPKWSDSFEEITLTPDSVEKFGLLFQINRQILYPFGIKLEETVEGTFQFVKYPAEGGLVFLEKHFDEGQKKFNNFMSKIGLPMMKKRREIYDMIIQGAEPDGKTKQVR